MLIYLVLNPSVLICFKCVELYQLLTTQIMKNPSFCPYFFVPISITCSMACCAGDLINLTLARNYGNFGKLEDVKPWRNIRE